MFEMTELALDLANLYELTYTEAMEAVDLINNGWDVDEAIEAAVGESVFA